MDYDNDRLTPNLVIWHVTTVTRAESIRAKGLDPKILFPKRIDRTSYFVVTDALMWAIAHVCQRQVALPEFLTCIHTRSKDIGAWKFMAKGIYRCMTPVPPEMLYGEVRAITAMALYDTDESIDELAKRRTWF